MTRSRAIRLAFALVFLVSVVFVARSATLGNEAAPVRLVQVSSRDSGPEFEIVIQASEPPSYTTLQPNDHTVVVELRNVTAHGVENRVVVGGPIAHVAIEEAEGDDGALTRVRLELTAPLSYSVRSDRNTIRLGFARGASDSGRLGATAEAGAVVSREVAVTAPLATQLQAVQTLLGPQAVTVTLGGNGILQPSRIHLAEHGPPHVVIDLPDVRSAVPSSISVDLGPIRQIRVARQSDVPLVTRVVLDLEEPVAYHVERSDPPGADLRVVFPFDRAAPPDLDAATGSSSGSSGGVGGADPSAQIVPRDPAVADSPNRITLDPMAALRALEMHDVSPEQAAAVSGLLAELAGATPPRAEPDMAPPPAQISGPDDPVDDAPGERALPARVSSAPPPPVNVSSLLGQDDPPSAPPLPDGLALTTSEAPAGSGPPPSSGASGEPGPIDRLPVDGADSRGVVRTEARNAEPSPITTASVTAAVERTVEQRATPPAAGVSAPPPHAPHAPTAIPSPQPDLAEPPRAVAATAGDGLTPPRRFTEVVQTTRFIRRREVTNAPRAQVTQTRTLGGGRQYTGSPISMDFQNADLRSVLRTFAEISGLNVVIDPQVQGSVDVALVDVPWDQALDIILRANQLGYDVDGTVVRIAPLATLADEEQQRRELAEQQALAGELVVLTRTLSYARASDLSDLITQAVLSSRGQVQIDPRTNTVIITDLQDRLGAAQELIDTLDRLEPQVEIEARIVQASQDYLRELGVQWGITGRVAPDIGNTTPLTFPNRGGVSGRAGGTQGPEAEGVDNRALEIENAGSAVSLRAPSATSALGLTLGAVDGSLNLDVILSAAENDGAVKILSNPRVTTQNNVQATIIQGDQIPIQTVANNTVTVTFKDAALRLAVTPQITAADTVIMQIEIDNDFADFGREVNGVPPIVTQSANTTVQVANGETTVIGGIYESEQTQSNRRVPGLNRIPLLGWLFKSESDRQRTDELLIFLTPFIVR